MPVIRVVLSYKDLHGIPIPDPEGYPDRLIFKGLDSVEDVTLELVMETLNIDLEDRGVRIRPDITITCSVIGACL